MRRNIVFSCLVGERVLGRNWDLGFLRVFLCTIVSLYFIVKSLQLRGRGQIAEPHKYCLVHVIVFFGEYFLYLFCFSQGEILVKFPTTLTKKKYALGYNQKQEFPLKKNIYRNKNKPNSVYPSNRFHPKKDSVQKSDGLKQIYCHFQTSKDGALVFLISQFIY